MKQENFEMDKWCADLETLRLVAFGESGSGKTFFMKRLVSRLQTVKKWSTISVDPKDEFNYPPIKPDIVNQATFIRRINKLKFAGNEFKDLASISEFAAAIAYNFRAILYLEEGVEIVSKMENLVVSHPLIYKVLQQGRSKGVKIIFSTQMVSQTNLAFVRQATHILLFWMKPSECRLVEEILSLPKYSLTFGLSKQQIMDWEKAIAENKDIEFETDVGLYTFYIYKAPNSLHYYKAIPKTYKETKGKVIEVSAEDV